MNQARILLVDDEPTLLLTVGDQLRLEGYDVMTAATGEAALHILKDTAPDLIILDVSMPGMTGLALLKKLSGPDGKPRSPILVFTARSNMEQFFKTTGVEGFLSKSGDPSTLLSEIKRILVKTRKPAHLEASEAPKRKNSVLILEDEPLLNLRLKTSFTIAGYEATSLTDPHSLTATLKESTPAVILLKAMLPGTTGTAVAESLADYTTAKGIGVVLYDGSGVHKSGDKFVNVDKFVPSNTPADLIRAVAAVVGR